MKPGNKILISAAALITVIVIATMPTNSIAAGSKEQKSSNSFRFFSSMVPFKKVEPSVIWARMRNNFQMDFNPDNPQIKREIRYYQRHQSQLRHILARSEPYLYLIINEIEKRGLPSELALLPIIESAYNPFVKSPVGATGLWQIMPRTGKHLGVKTNWWYDGKLDVLASTDAALNYLTFLNNKFKGDWLLSLAGYNAGEGTVGRAIKRNRGASKRTDFWNLRLPKETKNYVPKLLALAHIFKDPDKYGITLVPIANKPYAKPVSISSKISLKNVANLAEMSLKELHRLNPGFKHHTTKQNVNFDVLIPISNISKFEKNLIAYSGERLALN